MYDYSILSFVDHSLHLPYLLLLSSTSPGCLIRDSTSALVDEIGQLQPPFTMYLKPHPSLSINITLALSPKTSKHEPNETKLNTDEFKEDTWHRVIFLVAKVSDYCLYVCVSAYVCVCMSVLYRYVCIILFGQL